MANEQKLADLFVEFSAKGMDLLVRAIDEVRDLAKTLAEQITQGAKEGQDAWQKTPKVMETVGRAVDEVRGQVGNLGTKVAEGAKQISDRMGQSAVKTQEAWHLGINALREEFGRTIEKLRSELQKLDEKVSEGAKKSQEAWNKSKEALKEFHAMATMALASVTATVMGFVTAGSAGSSQAALLSFQMGELSRTIAGIFRPELEAVIDMIRSIVDWFRSLSDKQLENIAYWVKFAAAIGVFIAVVPKLIAAIRTIIGALKALSIATAIQAALEGPTGWVRLAAAAAITGGAIAGITAAHSFASMGNEEGEGGKKKSRRSFAAQSLGFESVEAAYQRVALGAIRSGPDRQIELAEQQNQHLAEIEKNTRDKRPNIAR